MSCCGEIRHILSLTYTPTGARTPPDASASRQRIARTGAQAQIAITWVLFRYTEERAIFVRGPVTGSRYAFSATEPVQPVDRRDAQTLLGTRLFVRENTAHALPRADSER